MGAVIGLTILIGVVMLIHEAICNLRGHHRH